MSALAAITMRDARDADARAVIRLLEEAKLDAPFDPDEFVVAEMDRRIVACARMKALDDGTQELASVAVAKELRGTGIGSEIVQRALVRARGVVYALALAPGFFERHGFARIDTIPAPLRPKADAACASTPFVAMAWRPAPASWQEVRSTYDAIAREGGGCCGPSLSTGDPVGAAHLREGERVVDLGCGMGGDLARAARAVGASGRAFGVDFAPAMLERARATTAALPQAEVREGRIESLPLDDASVDVVVSNCVVNLSEDKAAVLRESFRVLAPGGRLVVSDTMRAPGAAGSVVSCDCVGGALSEADWRAMLAEAGFVDVSVSDEGPYAAGARRGLVRARKPALPSSS